LPPLRSPGPRKTLASWFTTALLAVYAAVMALKLAQAYLLVAAPARHARYRKAILFVERALRTLVSVRLVAYSPQYQSWLGAAPVMRTARLLLLNSGFTIACWNIFCLPLDFPSQVTLTCAFVLSILPSSLQDIHSALQYTPAAAGPLVRLHELLLSAAGKGLSLVATAACQGTWAAAGPSSLSAPVASPLPAPVTVAGDAAALTCQLDGAVGNATASAAVCSASIALPLAAPAAAAAPDGPTAVALGVFACCYSLFVCAACPLWLAYHLERTQKQRWLLSHPSVAWSNPPRSGAAGAWPSLGAALRQLGRLLVVCFAASEVIIALWRRLGLPF
jgi:hypothetical protein